MSATNKNRLVTIKEAAAIKGVSDNSVQSWITKKLLSTKRKRVNGKRIHLIHLSDLEKVTVRGKRNRKPSAKKLKTRQGDQDLNVQSQAIIEAVAYLFGHCEAFIEIYARRTGLPAAELARGIAEHFFSQTSW